MRISPLFRRQQRGVARCNSDLKVKGGVLVTPQPPKTFCVNELISRRTDRNSSCIQISPQITQVCFILFIQIFIKNQSLFDPIVRNTQGVSRNQLVNLSSQTAEIEFAVVSLFSPLVSENCLFSVSLTDRVLDRFIGQNKRK